MTKRLLPSVGLVVGAVLGSGSLRAQDAPPVDRLGGRWLLNPELSEDARQKIHEAMQGMGGGAGGGRGPMGPGGGTGHRSGGTGGSRGGHGGSRPGGGGEGLQALLEAPPEMTITPTEKEVVILEKDGRMRILHPDGQSHKAEGGTTEVKTRWDAARLVVETKTERGRRATETYEAAPDRSRLTVTLRLEGGPMPPISIKRVYDSAESKASKDGPGQGARGSFTSSLRLPS